jgi:F-type H+-transporting ATPase subunit epsilon
MAETLQFDLVSPERRLVSMAVERVQIPGMEGELTVLPNHAPFLTTLRPGILRVTAGSEVAEYVVSGGFAEITPTAASVLAEQAVPLAEARQVGFVAELLAEAERLKEAAAPEGQMAADQRVRDVLALQSQLAA